MDSELCILGKMGHFKHYLEVFRHHLNCFWPFQWKWKENVIFNKICLLFWTPFCNWPYSGHIYYLENVPVGPISPVWPLNVIWDFKNLIWSRKISIEIVLLLRHCAGDSNVSNVQTSVLGAYYIICRNDHLLRYMQKTAIQS